MRSSMMSWSMTPMTVCGATVSGLLKQLHDGMNRVADLSRLVN
jgi:hypothetical protein